MSRQIKKNSLSPTPYRALKRAGHLITAGLMAFSLSAARSSQEQKKLALSEKSFVERALSASPYFKKIKLEAQKRSSQILQAKYALSDWSFASSWNQTKRTNPSIDSFLSRESELTSWRLALQKKIPYGLSLSSSYVDMDEQSLNDPFLKELKPASIYRKSLNLELKANLTESLSHYWLMNSFRQSLDLSELSYHERLEDLALRALRQYWSASAAWERLQQTEKSLKTYKKLVAQANNKKKYNFLQPGERPQILAEYQNIQKLRDTAQQNYEKEKKALLLFLKENPDTRQVSFKRQPAKAPPRFSKIKLGRTRLIQIQKKKIQNQKLKLRFQQSSLFPALELVGKKSWTPASSTPDLSWSSAPGFYELGLSLKWIVFSKSFYERVNQERHQLKESEIDFEILKRELKNNMSLLEQKARIDYKNIERAKKANSYQKQAFRELQLAFNQGRVDIFQLIQTEKQMRASEIQKISSLGEYSVTLASLLALRDELIKKYLKL